MSYINFNGCENISDVLNLHSDKLPGSVLKQCFDNGKRNIDVRFSLLRTPILGVEEHANKAVFTTEDLNYKKVQLAFPLGLTVVTSVTEAGDIWWPHEHDDWSRYYSIDGLNEEDFNVDSVLKFAEQLPQTNLFIS